MDLQDLFEQAMRLDERGELDAAVALLDENRDRIPETAPYLKFAGQLYQRLGADGQSLALLERALALTPDDPELLLSLTFHYSDNGRPDLALDFVRHHLAQSPDSLVGQTYLGRTLDWLGRLEEAETTLVRAVELGPRDVEAHLHLGRVRLRLGHLDTAAEIFRAIDRFEPGNVLADIGRRRAAALAKPKPVSNSRSASVDTIVCVKAGQKYGPDYVNRLASMVKRQTTRAIRIVCFTDDAHGLAPGIEAQNLPADGLTGWWNKVALFGERLPGVSGRVLYLDLDVVITGSLDPLLDQPGDFVIMDNDYVPGFNSSVVLFEVGARPEIWREFERQDTSHIHGDQDWLALMAPDAELWPPGWCVPYRLRAAALLPSDAKVVVFSGRPNPDEYPAPWIRELWR